MKKIFTLISLIIISYSSMAQWLPQASGFTAASRGIQYMHAVDTNVVWAAAYDGTNVDNPIQDFTRTVNGGELWTPGTITNAAGTKIAMIFGLNADTAYAALYAQTAGSTQGIWRTTDGGATWTRQASASYSNSSSFTNVVHFFNDSEGFAMGDPINGEFEIYTTSNGGDTWMPVLGSSIANPLSGEWGVVGYYDAVGDTAWFGTNKGRVYRTIDKGHNWEVFTTSLPTTAFVDLEFVDHLYGVAQNKGSGTGLGDFAETFDGGATWTDIVSTGPTLTADFSYVPGTEQTFVSTGSDASTPGEAGIAFSYDGGHTWEFFPDTEGFQFLAVDFVNPTTGWVGAFNESSTVGGMYRFNGSLIEPQPPTNLTAEVTNDVFVNLSWETPVDLGGNLLGYNVWRNGLIIEPLLADTFFVDEITENGGYIYMITAVYENGESEPSNSVEVEITGISVKYIDLINNLKVYPNPATDVINIKADQTLTRYELMNPAGQVVISSDINSNTISFKTYGISEGLYILKVFADDKTSMRKILIK